MKRNCQIFILCFLFFILIIACGLYCKQMAEYKQYDVYLAITGIENQRICIDNSFSFDLSDNILLNKNREKSLEFMQNGSVIGGIAKYSDSQSSFPNLFESNKQSEQIAFLKRLGIPEANNPSLYMIETGLYNGWEVWFGTDGIDVTHNLFPCNNLVYDLWFDHSQFGREESFMIRDSIEFK